jgi:hypothetical protein
VVNGGSYGDGSIDIVIAERLDSRIDIDIKEAHGFSAIFGYNI